MLLTAIRLNVASASFDESTIPSLRLSPCDAKIPTLVTTEAGVAAAVAFFSAPKNTVGLD